jgi:hypothetical protein
MKLIRLAVEIDAYAVGVMKESDPHLAEFGLNSFHYPPSQKLKHMSYDGECIAAIRSTLVRVMARLVWNSIAHECISNILKDPNRNPAAEDAWVDLRDTVALVAKTAADYLLAHTAFFLEPDQKIADHRLSTAIANALIWPLSGFAKLPIVSIEQRASAKAALIQIGVNAKMPSVQRLSKLFDDDPNRLQTSFRVSKHFTEDPDVFYHLHMIHLG